jgi:dTDP-4-amino-4,6-dideoxygalactose transaminase
MSATNSLQVPIGRPSVGEEEVEAVSRVIRSGMLTQGKEVAAAEQTYAEVCGTKYAFAVANGTLALELALAAHGVGRGDEVITTPFSFFATASSILRVGATPVFVDIDPRSYCITAEAIEKAITPKTKAIMPVHLYGRIADMKPIMQLAQSKGLAVIEDAAQAVGSSYHGKVAGSFGTGCFSLHGSKNITSGEGGMVTTNDDAIAERLRLLRNHGSAELYVHEEASSNFRMTDMQAAMLRVQLDKLEKISLRRQENAAYYDTHITAPGVVLPLPNDTDNVCVYQQYTIRFGPKRDQIREMLLARGVQNRTFYQVPIHLQSAIGGAAGSFPIAEAAANEVLSIPVHSELTIEEREYVAKTVNEVMAEV